MTSKAKAITTIALLSASPILTTALSALLFQVLFQSDGATVIGGVIGAGCGAAFALAVGGSRLLVSWED